MNNSAGGASNVLSRAISRTSSVTLLGSTPTVGTNSRTTTSPPSRATEDSSRGVGNPRDDRNSYLAASARSGSSLRLQNTVSVSGEPSGPR